MSLSHSLRNKIPAEGAAEATRMARALVLGFVVGWMLGAAASNRPGSSAIGPRPRTR